MAAEFAVAPVTLGLTVGIIAIGRLTRWHPCWLALPSLIGIGWAVLEDPGRAFEGFAAGGPHVLAFLASPGSVAAHLVRLPAELSRWREGIAGQFPLGLTAAAAQAALENAVRGWLWSAGPRCQERAAGNEGPYRPGLGCAVRRTYRTATLSRGQVATTIGACIGIERNTGRRAAVSWAEAAGGVLITGDDQVAVTRTGLDLAIAAIQHRKAVIVVDLSADPGPVTAAIAAACSTRQAPLRTWPRAAGTAEAGDDAGNGPIGLDGVLARREVLLAQSGRAAHAGGLARIVAADLIDALAGRRALGVPADGLAWFNGCEQGDAQTLDELVALAKEAGMPLVLGTASGHEAARLAGRAGVIAVRGRPPRDLPEPLAGSEGCGGGGGRAVATRAAGLPALLLAGSYDDDLSLLVRGPVPRHLARCRAVRARRYRRRGSR